MSTDVDPWWELLVSSLSSAGDVSEREPHGLVVTVEQGDGTKTVEIVMSPAEWDDLVSISWGVLESAVDHVHQLVWDLPGDFRYLVYEQYRLVPRRTPTKAPDPDLQRMQELAASYPDGVIPGGGWFACSPKKGSRLPRDVGGSA